MNRPLVCSCPRRSGVRVRRGLGTREKASQMAWAVWGAVGPCVALAAADG